jgi:pyruvate dehydrogenase E2 component (dihydrolipoamide acetyltransferase)
MKAIIMPKMGFTMTESTIVQWLKRAGDAVQKGEPIAEVTTDKVNMEVEAPESGTLAGLKFDEGDVVPVTETIAYVLEAGEVLSTEDRGTKRQGDKVASSVTSPSPETAINATPVAMRVAQERGVDLAQVRGTGPGGKITREDVEATASSPLPSPQRGAGEKVRATPTARRLASEHAIDLNAITGSGPNGRVQGADVTRAEEHRRRRADAQAASGNVQSEIQTPNSKIAYAGMRKTIGTRLQQSYQTAPHVTFSMDVDVTNAEALRARANTRPHLLTNGEGNATRVSLTAILAKACAWALLRHPMMNAQLDLTANEIVLNDAAHIGIAVALSDGLIVPVVRDVHAKGLWQLANEIGDLGSRAKTNKLKPHEMSGGTFTISNLGMFGIDRFTAIINPPETAILAVGRARKMFVPDVHNQPVLRPMMTLTLSADHRVIDGAVAAQFMADLSAVIENPESMLL